MHKESDREVKARSVFLFAVLVTYCQNLSIKTKGGTNMIYGYARNSQYKEAVRSHDEAD